MTLRNFVRYAFGIAAGIAFLASCSGSGSTPSLGGSSVAHRAIPGSHNIPMTEHPIAHSWMRKPLKGTTGTLWATDSEYGSVDMIAYPSGTLTGQVSGFEYPEGACSDKNGNVYVADFDLQQGYEIKAGTTKVINSWATGGETAGCSVSNSGDVAFTNYSPSEVVVFPGGGPSSVSYPAPGGGGLSIAGYDPHGNLFAICSGGSQCGTSLAELPAGGSKWILLNFHTTSPLASTVQNEGKYLGIGGIVFSSFTYGIDLVRVSGSQVTLVKTLAFTGNCAGSYIENPSSWGEIDAKPDGVSKKSVKGYVLTNIDCFPSPLEIFGKNGGGPTGSITAVNYQFDRGVTFTKP